MRIRYVSVASIVIALFLCSSCAKKNSPQGEKFGAASIRGEWYEFTDVRFGEIAIPVANAAKLTAADSRGNPLYSTAEIVQWIAQTDQVALKPEHGFAVRFIVPEINDNDYVIITADIEAPAPIKIGDHTTSVIQASFRYDARNNGDTEYIWYLPEGEIISDKYKGAWKISLSADNVQFLTKTFFLK